MDKNTVREMIQNMRAATAEQLINASLIYGPVETVEASATFNDFYDTINELNEARP